MDFLNRASTQARDLLLSLTPAARITAGLLLTVVVISLAYLFNHQMSGPDAYLMGGEYFTAGQLPSMEAAFAKAGLIDYQTEGNRIRIPRGQHAAYMGALADGGALPPNFETYFDKALSSGGAFISKQERTQRMNIAKQNTLALIIRSMRDIENASVIFDLKKGRGLSKTDIVTAMVSVKPLGSEPLEPKRVPHLRKLVAGAIAGLKPENVTVADVNGRTYGAGGEDGLGDPLEDPYYSRKAYYEQQLEAKIRDLVSHIPGAVVHVNAELTTDLRHVVQSVKVDPKPVTTFSQALSKTNRIQGNTPGGLPGLAAQGGPTAPPVTVRAGRSTSTEQDTTEETIKSVVSTNHETRETIGLTPKSVKATIGVPSTYYVSLWKDRNPVADGQEPQPPPTAELNKIKTEVKTQIEAAVVALLPAVAAGDDPIPNVTVTTFDPVTTAAIEPPSFTQDALAWAGQYWTTVSMMGLVVFSLLVLRSMVRAAPSGVVPEAAETASGGLSIVVGGEGDDKDEEGASRLKRRFQSGPSLKDDLAEMVHEDPDAAAAILGNWIGNAG